MPFLLFKVGKNVLKPEEFEIVDGSYTNNTKKVTLKIKAKGLSWCQSHIDRFSDKMIK